MLQSKDIEGLNGNKYKTCVYAAYKRLTSDLKTPQTESEEMQKGINANGNANKARVAILISDKIDFKTKTVTREKEGHYIMIKGSIQEDITIVNIYVPNIGSPKYIK